MARIDDLRAEYKRLVNSMEFAYAMGHTRTLGARDPAPGGRRRTGGGAAPRDRRGAASRSAYALIDPCGSSTYFSAAPLSKSS